MEMEANQIGKESAVETERDASLVSNFRAVTIECVCIHLGV